MRGEIYYDVSTSSKRGYPVRYIDPETLEVCTFPGPFKDPCDANTQFDCFVAHGRGVWLTRAGFKAQVQEIANDRKKLEEWNACVLSARKAG